MAVCIPGMCVYLESGVVAVEVQGVLVVHVVLVAAVARHHHRLVLKQCVCVSLGNRLNLLKENGKPASSNIIFAPCVNTETKEVVFKAVLMSLL